MDLTIANISTQISDADLQTAVAAIGKQVTTDFQPEWGATANLNGTTTTLTGLAPVGGIQSAVIYVGDSSQDPTTGVSSVLGYHFQNFATIPYGFVYLDVCAQANENWTVTLSHEVLELLADPSATMTMPGPAPNGVDGTVNYDLEVCDPTQGDSYLINTVQVSNFVGRSYFGLTGGSGNLNFLKLPLVAFGVRPLGYFQYEDGNGAHQILGDRVTARQFAAKKLMKAGRRNERRKLKLEQVLRKVSVRSGVKEPTQSNGPQQG